MTDKTVPKQLTPWKPGQSGNPAGRPRGARNKHSENFINAFAQDFEQHGAAVIEKVRKERPKAVAIAVRNVSGRRRWSKLDEWLRPMVAGASSVTARAV